MAVQVIACAGDMYYIDKTYSKRTYELIFGSVLMLFAFVPVRAFPDHTLEIFCQSEDLTHDSAMPINCCHFPFFLMALTWNDALE